MNIFQQAELLQVGTARKSRKEIVKPGVVIRRNGCTVKDTVVHVEKKIAVRKKSVRVDRENLDGKNYDQMEQFQNLYWSDNSDRRKILGKFIYERREELLMVIKNYDPKRVVSELSLNGLISVLAEIHAEIGKSAKVKEEIETVKPRSLGEIFEGFKIVSSVSIIPIDYEAMAMRNAKKAEWERFIYDGEED